MKWTTAARNAEQRSCVLCHGQADRMGAPNVAGELLSVARCSTLCRSFWITGRHRNLPTRAREGVTRKQPQKRPWSVIESEPEPSVTEPLLLTVATDCGDESRGGS